MNPSESILDLLKKDESGAFRLLFDRYYDNLLLYCYHILDDLETAEDIVSSTCGIASAFIHSRAIWTDSFSKWLKIKLSFFSGNTRKDTIYKFHSPKKVKSLIMTRLTSPPKRSNYYTKQ